MPFENVKYFLGILQILLDYFLFAVLTLMYHSTRGKRLQTTKGIKSCKKVQMCIELCTRVWKKSCYSRPGHNGLSYSGQVTFPIGGGGRGVGYSGFQVTGMIKGLFWVWNFQFQDFFRKENFGKLFFWVAWFKWGFFGVFKTNVCIFRVISFYAFWKFLWLGNSAWDIFGFCWKPQGFFG